MRVAIVALVASLAACAAAPVTQAPAPSPSLAVACPPPAAPPHYDAALVDRAAAERAALPNDSVLRGMLDDYAAWRAELHQQAEKHKPSGHRKHRKAHKR